MVDKIIINSRIKKKLEDIELLLDAEHAQLDVIEKHRNKKTIPLIKDYISKIKRLFV